MDRRRPAFLKRSIANEDRRRRQARAESGVGAASFRWAALGVAVILMIAVVVGFGRDGHVLAGWIGGLGWMTEPVLFGFSAANLLMALIVALACALMLWREARRARPRTPPADRDEPPGRAGRRGPP